MRVQEAYELSDIDELRALAVLADRTALPVSTASSLERLTKEQNTLEQHIQRLLKEIEKIESQPPLTMQTDLLNGDWVRNRCEAIQTTIIELQKRCAGLTSHIENLLRSYPGEKRPGQN